MNWDRRPPTMCYLIPIPDCPYCGGDLKMVYKGEGGVNEMVCEACKSPVNVYDSGHMNDGSDEIEW